jgi:mercuric ion binding protein
MLSVGVCGLLSWTGAAQAETKLVVTGVHLCCPACTTAVQKILKNVDGVEVACNSEQKTITITATDEKAAQKAVDALAAGGFYGKTDSKDIAFTDDSGALKGKVQTLTLTGVHNCCQTCTKAIKMAVKTVDGVKGDTAKPKVDTFEVTGDFDALELIKALNAAGFHAKVKE